VYVGALHDAHCPLRGGLHHAVAQLGFTLVQTPVPDFDQGTQTTPDEPVVIDFEDLSEAYAGS
jgi:hypothetical protein